MECSVHFVYLYTYFVCKCVRSQAQTRRGNEQKQNKTNEMEGTKRMHNNLFKTKKERILKIKIKNKNETDNSKNDTNELNS